MTRLSKLFQPLQVAQDITKKLLVLHSCVHPHYHSKDANIYAYLLKNANRTSVHDFNDLKEEADMCYITSTQDNTRVTSDYDIITYCS